MRDIDRGPLRLTKRELGKFLFGGFILGPIIAGCKREDPVVASSSPSAPPPTDQPPIITLVTPQPKNDPKKEKLKKESEININGWSIKPAYVTETPTGIGEKSVQVVFQIGYQGKELTEPLIMFGFLKGYGYTYPKSGQ